MYYSWSNLLGYLWSNETGKPNVGESTSSLGNENEDKEAEQVVDEVLGIHWELRARKCLRPCEMVDGLFGRLVEVCVENRRGSVTEKVLQDPRILSIKSNLRQICDEAESLLETYWAEKIIGDGDSTPKEVHQRLQSFPYIQNYIDLTHLELSLIHGINSSPDANPISKIAFVGSGPLPLTSLFLLNPDLNPNLNLTNRPLHFPTTNATKAPPTAQSILNIDSSPLALNLSQTLCKSLGPLAKGMHFLLSDARNPGPEVDFREFEVVYLAALVGRTQSEKEHVLEKVVQRMSEGALLVVRFAERLRGCLYPAFDPSTEKVMKCLDICAIVHPYNYVVNSVVIGRVKRRDGEEAGA